MTLGIPRARGPYQCLDLRKHGEVHVVQFIGSNLDEAWIEDMAEELHHLIQRDGCRKLVLSLSGIECLYSLLLGKLMTVRRLMHSYNGRLRLCEASPHVREVFRICCLERFFDFYDTREDALRMPW